MRLEFPLGVAEKANEIAQITQNLFAISNPNMKDGAGVGAGGDYGGAG